MPKLDKKLGELLVDAGLASRREVDNALNAQIIFGDHLGTNLVEFGIIDIDTLGAFLSRQYGFPRATREELENVSQEVLDLVPAPAAQRLRLLPLNQQNDQLTVVMMDPSNKRIIDRIGQNLGMTVTCKIATEIEIRYYLEIYYDIPREPRHIILMKQTLGSSAAIDPAGLSARALTDHLDRSSNCGDAIQSYFDDIKSLHMIPTRNSVKDLTQFDLTPELTFLLHQIDGLSSIRELLMASLYPRILTLRGLVYLANLQLIRFEEA